MTDQPHIADAPMTDQPHIADALVTLTCRALQAQGVTSAVVCPGSRDAPLVVELQALGFCTLHGAIDERSAAFLALGMAAVSETPVALVVTSGTALLDAAPAIAEARYQGVPLAVVAADRPRPWREQLDGQTIDQPAALHALFRATCDLATPLNDEQQWHVRRELQATLARAQARPRGPVLINVCLNEPLLAHTNDVPPLLTPLTLLQPEGDDVAGLVVERLLAARRPLIVVGHLAYEPERQRLASYARQAAEQWWICEERLAGLVGGTRPEQCLEVTSDELCPDLVVHVGGSLIGKRLRSLLRRASNLSVIRVCDEPALADTFQHADTLAVCSPLAFFRALAYTRREPTDDAKQFRASWSHALNACLASHSSPDCVERLERLAKPDVLRCYANSSAVRLAETAGRGHVFCNRGTNGIDGCLAQALGVALAARQRTLLVIGDLAFGYDANALWCSGLHSADADLRVLLLNNGGGGIFERFTELRSSPARPLVVGQSSRSFSGLAGDLAVTYRQVSESTTQHVPDEALTWLLDGPPEVKILEVIHDKNKA